jgi:hypothetical protein
MDRTLLPSLGIVAGIMTLAYYVGGSKEVRWAETEFNGEREYSIYDKDGMISWTDKDRTQKYFKDWKPKDYPYEKRVVSETKSKWCENCGELDDADENSWNYYQFILKQKNSSTPAMRYITGGHCEGCGSDLCQNCMEGRTSGNFNPLFEPACDDCGYIFCKECKDEDEERCHSCQERYEEDVCDCCGHVHHAESFSAEVPDKYKEPFKVPIVKIYGENGAIVIGHGVREYLIQEIKYAYVEATGTTYLHTFSNSGLQKKSTQELVDILDHYLKEQDDGGASLEYHDMDGWVGWQIPDFERE